MNYLFQFYKDKYNSWSLLLIYSYLILAVIPYIEVDNSISSQLTSSKFFTIC